MSHNSNPNCIHDRPVAFWHRDNLGEFHTQTLLNDELIYVASPYTPTDEAVRRYAVLVDRDPHVPSEYDWCADQVRYARYFETRRAIAILLAAGLPVVSPIVHCHEIARAEDFPKDFAFWRCWNHAVLRRCTRIWVLAMADWEISRGVTDELLTAGDVGLRRALVCVYGGSAFTLSMTAPEDYRVWDLPELPAELAACDSVDPDIEF